MDYCRCRNCGRTIICPQTAEDLRPESNLLFQNREIEVSKNHCGEIFIKNLHKSFSVNIRVTSRGDELFITSNGTMSPAVLYGFSAIKIWRAKKD